MDRLPAHLVAMSRAAHDPDALHQLGARAAAELLGLPAAVLVVEHQVLRVAATAEPTDNRPADRRGTAFAQALAELQLGAQVTPLQSAVEPSSTPVRGAWLTTDAPWAAPLRRAGFAALGLCPVIVAEQPIALLLTAIESEPGDRGTRTRPVADLADQCQLASYLGTFLGTATALAQMRQSSLVVDALPEAIIGISRDRDIVLWNAGAQTMYAIPEEDALGQPLERIVPTEYGPSGSHGPAISLINRGQWSGRVRQRTARGEQLHVHLTITSIVVDGELQGAVCINRDITAMTQAEERRAEQERRVQALLDASLALTAVLDASGRITAVNTAWAAGVPSRQPLAGQVGVGADYLAALAAADSPAAGPLRAGILDVLTGSRATYEQDYDLDLPQGGTASYAATVAPMPGTAGGAFISHNDISQRKALERELGYQASHDSLTGLLTRGQLESELDAALSRPGGPGVGVVILDLDRFKDINDTLGHPAGDQVLVAMARRLAGHTAAQHVARLSGDEFAVASSGVRSHIELARLATDLQRIVAAPLMIQGRELFFGCNIGTSVSTPAEPMTAADLLRAADTAMYRAKERGRNSIVAFDEGLRLDVARRVQLSSWLARALENDQIAVHYQPQFRCLDGRQVGVEALVRWHHPLAGDVSPSEFIAIAEESGTIEAIGAWVLRTACEQGARWASLAGEDFSLAVNLSPLQLISADLVDTVRGVLLRTRLPAACLTLEVTEGALIEDPSVASQALAQLRAIGVRISVDDFGTGYSSLAYLARFPLDELKIDRMFVRDLERDERAKSLAAGIVRIGHALGMRVTAEGVETPGQLRLLTGIGADCYQGFLAGRAESAELITQRLAQGAGLDLSAELAREAGRMW